MKKKHHRKSSSSSYDSNNSNSSIKDHQSSSKTLNGYERNKRVHPNSFSTLQDDLLVVKSESVNKKDDDANWLQNNVCKFIDNC